MRKALCAPVAGPRKRTISLGDFENISGPAPSFSAPREPLRRLMRWGVSHCLTPPQQQAVELYYYQQQTMEKISQDLGVHPSTVSRRLQAARNRLTDFFIQASLLSKLQLPPAL